MVGVIIFINITFTNKIKYTLKCFKWHNPLAVRKNKPQWLTRFLEMECRIDELELRNKLD